MKRRPIVPADPEDLVEWDMSPGVGPRVPAWVVVLLMLALLGVFVWAIASIP